MNRISKTLMLVGLAIASLAYAADRVDTWLESSVDVQSVTLLKRSDGGCAVYASANISKNDGGQVQEAMTEPVDVGGANRTTCLDIINNRASVLFKANRGF